MPWRAFILHIPNWNQRIKVLNDQLRPLIAESQANRLIAGYNYNFYGPQNAHIALRLEPLDEDSLADIRAMLRKLGIPFTEQDYDEPDSVKKAYELGSLWASLFWELVEKGRTQTNQFVDANLRRLALHGLFNSTGSNYDDEALSYCIGLCCLATQKAICNPKLKEVAEGVLKVCENKGLLQRRA